MDKLKQSMTDQEWIKIYEMSNDKNLFNNLCQSLFPMIYGNNKTISIQSEIFVLNIKLKSRQRRNKKRHFAYVVWWCAEKDYRGH